MKKNFYLMTAFCAIILSACSGNTDPTVGTEEPGIAKVVLSVNPATRATGTTEPNDDNTAERKINRLTVAVFNAGGAVLTIQEKEGENPTTLSFDCPLSAVTVCSAIVVANAPSGHFAGATTRDGFLLKTFSLGNAQTSDNLPMSGEVKEGANTTFTLTPGTTITGTLSVALSRLVSRVIVKKVATDFSSTGAYSASVFKLTNVFVRNALSTVKPATGGYADTKPDGVLGATNYLTGGGATWDAGLTTLASLNSTAASGWSALETLTHNYSDVANYYYFYVFPNENSSYPTTLVLQGTFDTDGDGNPDEDNSGTVFYPVVINKNQIGTEINGGATTGQTGTIARSTKYQLEITIRSKGVASPADKIDPASLSVTVTVEPWLPYTQTVVFD